MTQTSQRSIFPSASAAASALVGSADPGFFPVPEGQGTVWLTSTHLNSLLSQTRVVSPKLPLELVLTLTFSGKGVVGSGKISGRHW